MSSYDKWLAAQPNCRGLSLKKAFEGGEKAMLEKVLLVLKDANQMMDDIITMHGVDGYVMAGVHAKVKKVLDQLAKEVDDE